MYGQWAQVRLSGDTVFLAVFPGGWRVVAAGCTPRGSVPTTAPARELSRCDSCSSLLLVVVAVGLVYFAALGVLHR